MGAGLQSLQLRYRKKADSYHRFIGNLLIAVGALLPGIGGGATRFGHVEVLYVTEFVGIILIWLGYWWNVRVPLPRERQQMPAEGEPLTEAEPAT